jgi:D-alanyl-D-alanine carboxypeptidase (penicillin-binding protein 5/6)
VSARVSVVGADTVGGPLLTSPGIVVRGRPGSTKLPSVQADAWLLADLTTGEVLAAKDAHHRAMPASMLKTLTAVTLMPTLDRSSVITATYDEARADGGHVGIVPGATYSIWDLWHGLLLPSANDAAAALADANGGMAQTVAQMQAKATYLHADDTTVRNNSGLDNPAQLSSPYDMALFARAAMDIPDFRTVTATISYAFPGRPVKAGDTRHTYRIYSQNRLLLHGYRGTVGGKTGFTSLAHRTFWGAATRGGHTLVVTLFQIKDPTEKAARALLDWGFANVDKVDAVGTLVEPGVTASPSLSPTPTVSAPATSDGTSAAGTAPAGSRFQISWRAVGLAALVVLVLAAIALWWRRRSAAGSWESLPVEPGAATAPVLPAGRHTPTPPAAQRTSSVIVTRTAPRDADVPVPDVPVPDVPVPDHTVPDDPVPDDSVPATRRVDPDPDDATGPLPVVAAVSAPATPEAAPPVVPAAAAPAAGGNVRVIRPPARPS